MSKVKTAVQIVKKCVFFNFFFIFLDQVIYITKTCQDFGVVGISLYLSDLAEDLIYHFNQYSNGDETYAFLCDKNGLTIWHPSFPRPNIASYEPTYATDIKYFEKVPENLRHRLLTEEAGIVQISKANLLWEPKKSASFPWLLKSIKIIDAIFYNWHFDYLNKILIFLFN